MTDDFVEKRRKNHKKLPPEALGPESPELRRVEKDRRIVRIEDLLAEQYTTAQIVRLVVKEFGVAERTAYTDVSEAYAAVHADDAAESGIRLVRARRSWQRRLRRAEAAGDESAANYALDRICKLDGSYAPKKVEMSGMVGVTVNISMRSIVGVLDAAGLAALELVMQQVELAKARGELPAALVENDAEAVE